MMIYMMLSNNFENLHESTISHAEQNEITHNFTTLLLIKI